MFYNKESCFTPHNHLLRKVSKEQKVTFCEADVPKSKELLVLIKRQKCVRLSSEGIERSDSFIRRSQPFSKFEITVFKNVFYHLFYDSFLVPSFLSVFSFILILLFLLLGVNFFFLLIRLFVVFVLSWLFLWFILVLVYICFIIWLLTFLALLILIFAILQNRLIFGFNDLFIYL